MHWNRRTSTKKNMSDIHAKIGFKDNQFIAYFNFNLLKCSSTIKFPDFATFCKELKQELRSTTQKISPLPKSSSDAISRFDPKSLAIEYDEDNLLDDNSRGIISIILSDFINEKVEFAQLLAEAQQADI